MSYNRSPPKIIAFSGQKRSRNGSLFLFQRLNERREILEEEIQDTQPDPGAPHGSSYGSDIRPYYCLCS